MNKIISLPALGYICLLFTSCIGFGPSITGNGKVTKENRPVSNFDGIRVSRGMDVYIKQDSFQKVVVEADENLLDVIQTRVEDSNLIITVTENIREAKSKKVYVSVNHLSEILAMAGSNIFTVDTLRFDNLKVASIAGSSLKLSLITNLLSAKAAAGSSILLNGLCKNSECKAMAGSNIKAQDLLSGRGSAKANSGSNIWLTVDHEINANASSGGNIYYFGNPTTTTVKNSSGGNTVHK
jgi:hypothetical protein